MHGEHVRQRPDLPAAVERNLGAGKMTIHDPEQDAIPAPWLRIGTARRAVGDVRERGLRAAAALKSLGIGSGDAVATLLRNDYPFIELSLAAQHIGAYLTPINWHSSPAEVGYIADNSQARLLLGHADLLGAVAAALPAGLPVAACAAPEADAPLLETVGELPPWAEWIAGFEIGREHD